MTLKEYVKSDREQYEAMRANATRIEFGGDYRPGEPSITNGITAVNARPAADGDIPSHEELMEQSLFALRICGAMPDSGTEASMKTIRKRPENASGIPLVLHVLRDGYEEDYVYRILAAVTPFGNDPKKDELVLVAGLTSFHIINRSIPDAKSREERTEDDLTVGGILDRMASILNIGGYMGGDTDKCTCEQASKDGCMCSSKDAASPTFAFRSFTDKDVGKDSNKDTDKDGKAPKASNDPKATSNAPKAPKTDKTDKDDKDDTKGWKIGSYTIRVETKDGKTTITTSTDGGPEQTTTLDSDDGIGYPASTWTAFSRMESELDDAFDKFGRIGRLFDRLW